VSKMQIPWLSIAVGALVYLLSHSLAAAVATFIGFQMLLLTFLAVVAAIVKDAATYGNVVRRRRK
jgi:hypothetical protein